MLFDTYYCTIMSTHHLQTSIDAAASAEFRGPRPLAFLNTISSLTNINASIISASYQIQHPHDSIPSPETRLSIPVELQLEGFTPRSDN